MKGIGIKMLNSINSKKKKLTVADLSQIIGAETPNKEVRNEIVERVLTQSAYVKSTDAVIVACWYDRKKTIEEALERGAVVVFCQKEVGEFYDDPRICYISDPLVCVEKIEKYCEAGCDAKRIVITGSVGKTTTTGLINSIIANTFNTLTHHSMANSHGAILRNFQQLRPDHEFWVQEVGGVQPRYIESSAYMLHADVVVLTNIGNSHLDQYVTKQEIFKDKSSLERYEKYNGVVIINYDDPILKEADYSHKIISFAINDVTANYYAEKISVSEEGTEFVAICDEGKFKVKLNLFGEYNVYNALAAIAVGRWAGVPMDRIIKLIETYQPNGMRQNMLNIGGYKLLVDCFNAEPKTVLGSAETLSRLKPSSGGKRIFITGHIDKLGENSPQMHEELGHKLSELDIDTMVFYAGDSRYAYEAVIEDGYKNAYFTDSRDELDNWIKENVTREDITFYKSGQFKAALAKSIDHVYGTRFQNEQQFNEGIFKEKDNFVFRLRQDNIAELYKYNGKSENVEIPFSYNDIPVLRIYNAAFRRNQNIKTIFMPDSIENIGQEAFYCCVNLAKIRLSKKLKYIHRSAFNYCKKLIEVNLPEGLLHIEKRAFRECVELEEIIIPESVGFIEKDAFEKCPKLTIVCKRGSYAEGYARSNNISYRTI